MKGQKNNTTGHKRHTITEFQKNQLLVTASRLAIMLPAAAMLIVGLLAGLARIGILFIENPALREVHAPAMIFGFVSSLISLERAVAIRRFWAFSSPLFLSVGSALLIFSATQAVGKISILMGLGVMLLIYRRIWLRQQSIATSVQILANFVGFVSALLWLSGISFEKVSMLASLFLVLTIVGERIELGRVGGLTLNGERLGLALSTFTAVASITPLLWGSLGYIVLGFSILTLVIWLFVVDVARTTIGATGATRYMAVCLLSGYVWLFVAGATWIMVGEPKGKIFDLTTHAVLLGFVMSMIMAHASVILPAVLRIKLPYRKLFYVPLALLQVSLVARVVGDVRDEELLTQIGGAGNVLAIVTFLIAAATSAILATREVKAGNY